MLTSKSERGITLVELVVTIVILAIALVGVTLTINQGISQSSNTLLELRAVALAQAYLDEALGKRFDERSRNRGVPPCRAPDGPGGVPPNRECTTVQGANGSESRATYDDVDDYDDIDEGAGVSSPDDTLKDAQGNIRSGYDGFRVTMDVRYIDVATTESGLGQNNELDDNFDAKLITITVSHSALSNDFVFSAYKSNF